MTNTEQKIFNIILHKKNARIQHIASAAGVSSAYASIVCQGLCRRGHINFRRGLAVIPALADIPVGAPSVPTEESQTFEEQEVQGDGLPVPAAEEEPTTQETTQEETATPISSLGNLKETTMVALANAGYKTVGDLAEAPVSKLMLAGGMNVKQAADLINQARKGLGMFYGEK